MLHRFTTSISDIPLPERFTYPFCYTPHPLCVMAAEEVQNYLNKLARNLPIVFVSAHGDIEMAVRAMRHGAIDFLPKPVDDDKLLASLELAIEASIQNSQQARDIQDAKTRWSLLSPREQEVARLVAQGKLNKVIADELGISERTVQAHRANACQKLGVRHAVGLLQMIEKAEQ